MYFIELGIKRVVSNSGLRYQSVVELQHRFHVPQTETTRVDLLRLSDQRSASVKESEAAYVGFAVALCIPALALGLLTPVTNGMYDWQTAIGLFPVGYGYAVILALPFAVPAYLFARRHKLIRWWSTIIAGVCIGTIVDMILSLPCAPLSDCLQKGVHSLVVFGVIGGLAAFVFWVIWRQHRETP
jgi:hypothetical protein